MEARNTQHTKSTDPGVSQVVGLNGLDYSKINVQDMCYFLNDRVDLARNESYFDGYDPDEFSGSEMYEFLKFKTDNFDKIKFQLVIDEIRLFTPLFYKIVDDDIINEECYNLEWNSDDKLHDYIERTLELNDGLYLHCEQIKQFSLLAEKIYNQLKKGKKNEFSFSNYLSCENKEAIIEKIRALDRNTPKKIYIILKALFDNGSLLLSDNETIYKAYFEEFSYHLSYDTMKKGLNSYDLDKPDQTNSSKIENMINHLFD